MQAPLRFVLKALALPSIVLALTSEVSAYPYWDYGSARSSDWVLVTVRWVSVAPLREAETTWDPNGDTSAGPRNGMQALREQLGLEASTFAVVSTALSLLADPESARDSTPTHPDVRLDITWQGTRREHLISQTRPDTLSPQLDYAFLVRLSTLSAEGVRIAVEDVDGDHAEVIGQIVLTRDGLLTVARAGRVERREREQGLRELRFVAEPVSDATRIGAADLILPLDRGLTDSGLEVPAGAIVTVTSDGAGLVGARRDAECSATVTPRGLPGAECRRRNLQIAGLRASRHGSAVVLVGRAASLMAHSLGSFDLRAAPCIRFVMDQTGRVVVGVNDTELANNSGSFGFNVEYRYPTDGEDVEALRIPTACPARRRSR